MDCLQCALNIRVPPRATRQTEQKIKPTKHTTATHNPARIALARIALALRVAVVAAEAPVNNSCANTLPRNHGAPSTADMSMFLPAEGVPLLTMLGASRDKAPLAAAQGVLMQINLLPATPGTGADFQGWQLFKEAFVAARMLRTRSSSVWPMALVAANETWAWIQSQVPTGATPWDIHVPFDTAHAHLRFCHERMRPGAKVTMHDDAEKWLWKIATFLLTPFSETLYLDTDVVVLSRTFVSDLLHQSLKVADLVGFVDPQRPAQRMLHSKASSLVLNPKMYGRGIPPLCLGLMAYRLTPAVASLLERAAIRLLHRSNISDPTDGSLVRQGDQEMVWFELVSGPADTSLRILVLPEEYYCPGVPMPRIQLDASDAAPLAWHV